MNTTTEPTPTPRKCHSAGRTALVAASGAFVALGMIAGIGVVGAGAQADPDVQPAAETASSENDVEILDLDDAELDEFELEDGDMIAVEMFDAEAWAPFDECMDAGFGELEGVVALGDDDTLDEVEIMIADFDDAAFEAIEAECLDLLPADLKAEIEAEQAAWAPFEACIDGIAEPFGEDVVWLDTTDGGVAVAFGDDAGSVTISGTAGDIAITDSTGVTVLDEAMLDAEFEAMDAEFAACDDLLPEGAELEMFEEELLD